MTENLYESSQFTNHTNGNYFFQHSPSAPHYGVPNVLHSSPMSPRLNHEHLASPVTPGNEPSPLLDMPNSAGIWDYNQFGRGSSWGSSQDEPSESGGTSRIHPFNFTCQNDSTVTSKDGCGVALSQRLDSFSKAFPSKNIHHLFEDNNNRIVDKTSGDNHMTLAQSGAFFDGSERQPLGSPVFNPMDIQGQMQTMSEFHLSDQNPVHGLYQNPQHFQYGYQQHKQKATQVEANRGLYKPQSPWLHQHAYQSHLPPFPINLNQQQQQLHLQPREMFAHKTHQESHESTQSPTYSQDFKSPEHQNFQGLSLLSPHYQDQQYIHPFSHPSGVYLQQQEHVQPIAAKQNDGFHDGHVQPYEKRSAPNTPVFSSPKDDGQSGFNFNAHRSEDICSPHFSNKSSGVNKGVSQTNQFPHLPSHASQWSQVLCSSLCFVAIVQDGVLRNVFVLAGIFTRYSE